MPLTHKSIHPGPGLNMADLAFLRSFTKAAWKMSNINYCKRLKKPKLYSNECHMERYLCLCIWQSLHNHVSTLSLTWRNHETYQTGHHLCLPTLQGPEGVVKTAMRKSVKFQGVIDFNSLSDHVILWEGSKEGFKETLDMYLTVMNHV